MEGNATSKQPPRHSELAGQNPDAPAVETDVWFASPLELTWEQLDAAKAVVNLGGDAIEDTEHLYDGR
jgi:hypothetical protein